MEIKKGIATKVSNTIDVSGSGGRDNSHVETTHITTFRFDNQSIKLEMRKPSMISENDDVTVAGHFKNGNFVARAFKNNTTGVSGNNGVFYYLIQSVFVIIAMCVCIWLVYFGSITALLLIPTFILFLWFTYLIYTAVQNNRASQLITQSKLL